MNANALSVSAFQKISFQSALQFFWLLIDHFDTPTLVIATGYLMRVRKELKLQLTQGQGSPFASFVEKQFKR